LIRALPPWALWGVARRQLTAWAKIKPLSVFRSISGTLSMSLSGLPNHGKWENSPASLTQTTGYLKLFKELILWYTNFCNSKK